MHNINIKQALLLLIVPAAIFSFGCAKNNFEHTTAVIYVPPPPTQTLTVVAKPVPAATPSKTVDPSADPNKPLLIWNLEDGKRFRVDEEVPILFFVLNAKLKSDGGDFRVRYIVDDEEMKWLDSATPFWLSGWTPGKHTFRIELIGPDGWPYKNGKANIVTKEIEIVK